MILRVLLLGFFLALSAALAQRPPDLAASISLGGGPDAGSYQFESLDPICLYGSGSGDDWRVLYSSDATSADALTTLLLLVPGEAGASYFFSVGFGQIGTDAYREYAISAEGEALTPALDGQQARFTVTGATDDGVTVTAEVHCGNVVSPGGDAIGTANFADLDFGPGVATGDLAFSLQVGARHFELAADDDSAFCEELVEPGDLLYSYDFTGYNTLELYLPDLAAAFEGTSNFGLGFDLQRAYRPGEGEGWLRASEDGDILTLELDVTLASGIRAHGYVQCRYQR